MNQDVPLPSQLPSAVDLADAQRFDDMPDQVERMEIASAAAREQKKALAEMYPDLVMVTTGFRHRRDAQGVYALHPEPCVVLTVRDKWAAGGHSRTNEKSLPQHLFVTRRAGRKSARYGVPTDVQDVKWLSDVAPQGPSQIVMSTLGNPTGALTCALDVVTAGGSQRFALSALHVLSPMPDVDGLPRAGAPFGQSGGAQGIGLSTGFGGAMRSSAPSMDFQLASVNPTVLQAAFVNLPRGSVAYARSPADVNAIAHTSSFMVVVPTNVNWGGAGVRSPVYTQFSAYVNASFSIPYDVTRNGVTFPEDFRFSELIMVAAGVGNPVTLPGDSGSPVIAVSGGAALLVGMLIAGPKIGSGIDRMFILPAWTIFDPANWANRPSGTQALRPWF